MNSAIIAVTKSAYATFQAPPWWPPPATIFFLMMIGCVDPSSGTMSGHLALRRRGGLRRLAGLGLLGGLRILSALRLAAEGGFHLLERQPQRIGDHAASELDGEDRRHTLEERHER